LPASLEIFAENAGVADRDSVGRRYLIALSRKEAEIFILKVFAGKTRLVFFARQPEAGTQRINHDEDDRRAYPGKKNYPRRIYRTYSDGIFYEQNPVSASNNVLIAIALRIVIILKFWGRGFETIYKL